MGEGRIAALSTVGRISKFGVPLLECRTELLRAFADHPWLNALHLHVGSQVRVGLRGLLGFGGWAPNRGGVG